MAQFINMILILAFGAQVHGQELEYSTTDSELMDCYELADSLEDRASQVGRNGAAYLDDATFGKGASASGGGGGGGGGKQYTFKPGEKTATGSGFTFVTKDPRAVADPSKTLGGNVFGREKMAKGGAVGVKTKGKLVNGKFPCQQPPWAQDPNGRKGPGEGGWVLRALPTPSGVGLRNARMKTAPRPFVFAEQLTPTDLALISGIIASSAVLFAVFRPRSEPKYTALASA